jgi:hypothetical protein
VKVGDLVKDESGDHFLIIQRYKIHNYAGPNQWSDTLYCQSVKTGKLKRLSVDELEVVSESR